MSSGIYLDGSYKNSLIGRNTSCKPLRFLLQSPCILKIFEQILKLLIVYMLYESFSLLSFGFLGSHTRQNSFLSSSHLEWLLILLGKYMQLIFRIESRQAKNCLHSVQNRKSALLASSYKHLPLYCCACTRNPGYENRPVQYSDAKIKVRTLTHTCSLAICCHIYITPALFPAFKFKNFFKFFEHQTRYSSF